MWHNTRALNLAAAALLALSIAALAYAGTLVALRSHAFSLRVIELHGTPQHVRRTHVAAALQGHVSGTFFTADLERVRSRLETVAWVRRAHVRRSWPDRLEVHLEEHVAIARWGRPENARLLNTHGEIFSAVSDADLPLLGGPEGSEREVARRYGEFRALLEPLGLSPVRVLLNERLAWQVSLSNGLALQLGRDAAADPVNQRLARFVEAYPRTVGRLDPALREARLRVDLRYPNGFALRLPALERTDRNREAQPRA